MKILFQSRTKWVLVLALIPAAILLIGGYSAGANGRRAGSTTRDSSAAHVSDRIPGPEVDHDNDPEFAKARREYLDWYFGLSDKTLSPADHAKVMEAVRALPPSPLLEGGKFEPTTPGSSWIFPIPPPIQGFPPWDNNANSAVITVLGPHPTDSNVVYAAGPSGLAKSTDGGQTWKFLSDNWQSQVVSSISIDPNATNHVFVGTGSSYPLYCVGMYRSTDDGANWSLRGSNEFAGAVITRVAVDPRLSGATESTTVYVAVDRSNSSSGLWRSSNGGETWTRVLARPYNGIWAFTIDPSTNPSTLYMADSTGMYSGIDGTNWTLIYPSNSNWSQQESIAISVVNSTPYLLAPTAGASPVNKLYYYSAAPGWVEIPTLFSNGAPIGPWKFAVDPSDPNVILLGTAEFYRTGNRGGTWDNVRPQTNFRDIHVDVHAIAFSPALTGLAYVGNDGGIWKSFSHGVANSWNDLNQNLPGALLYNLAISQDGSVIAGTQDNGTVLSDSGGIWKVLLGGDSNRNLIDPLDSNVAYYTSYWSDYFQRYNKSTGQSVNIRPAIFSSEPCNFFPAFSMNRSSSSHLLAACQHVVQSFNQGNAWTTIGMSLADPNQPNEWWNTVGVATEAPSNPAVIYAVALGGRVWVTSDANLGTNAHWTNVTGNLGEVGGIYNIAIHPTNPQIAYLACGAGIYKTTTMGMGTNPWVNLHAPGGPAGSANFGYHDIVIDPDNQNNIIAACQMGVFASGNDGASWGSMNAGIPQGMLVSGLSFDPVHRKLAASTYGRGAYVITLGSVLPIQTPTPTPSPTPTPTPILNVTVALPVATIDTSTFNFTKAVTASTIDSTDDLVGFQGDFTFDSTVVTFQNPAMTAAGLTASNWNVAGILLAGSGPIRTLRISAFSNDFTPLSGSGTLFNLNMTRVSSTPGATTALTWADPDYNFFFFDSNFNEHYANTPPGSITIQAATFNISGTIIYCSNPSLDPVPGVTLTLTGSASASTLSNGSGNYLFSSLVSGGSYTITPSMAALSPGAGGINTIDVVATQRHFLLLGTPLSGCRLTAADVNGFGGVNTIDVIAIQRFFLGFSTGNSNVGKYQFSPAIRSYTPLTGDQTAQNYDALIFGDVASGFVHRPEGGAKQ